MIIGKWLLVQRGRNRTPSPVDNLAIKIQGPLILRDNTIWRHSAVEKIDRV